MFWHHSRERGSYRFWLHSSKGRGTFRVQACWRSWLCGASFGYDDGDGHVWHWSVRLPPVGLYVSVPAPKWARLRQPPEGSPRSPHGNPWSASRHISFSIHDWALWWDLWRDPMAGWSREVPKWRHGSFHPIDTVFGRTKCETTTLETRNVVVPMPEKSYPATAELVEYAWKRPRWFTTKRMKRVQIEIPGGIPHAGKGENSWDCGDDATFGITTGACASIPEGIGILVGSCLRTRVKYGGWSDYTWSRPEQGPTS